MDQWADRGQQRSDVWLADPVILSTMLTEEGFPEGPKVERLKGLPLTTQYFIVIN
jgi:hypothetical protein